MIFFYSGSGSGQNVVAPAPAAIFAIRLKDLIAIAIRSILFCITYCEQCSPQYRHVLYRAAPMKRSDIRIQRCSLYGGGAWVAVKAGCQ